MEEEYLEVLMIEPIQEAEGTPRNVILDSFEDKTQLPQQSNVLQMFQKFDEAYLKPIFVK